MGRKAERSIRQAKLRAALSESEALLRLQHGVTRCLVQAGGVPAAVKAVLRVVCTTKGWDCGRFFAVDDASGELVCTESWSRNSTALREFLRGSRGLRMARGAGLAGRVWQTGRPLWVSDVRKDRRVANPLLAENAGIHGAIVFPVESVAGMLGVIAISSREVRRPDPRLLRALEVVGRQLGEYVRHRRLAEEQRRFRAGMDASADMILLIDPESMRYVDVNETVCRTLGYSRDEILAMGPQDILPVPRDELQRTYQAFIANPTVMHGMNSVYRCKDGTRIPFESTRRLLRSEDGVVIVAISRDIRKRLETEAALRDSEARFRSLTQLSSDFFWETDASHRLVQIENAPKYGESARLDLGTAKAPWDLPSVKPDAAGWAAHRAQMEARQPFRNFEYARLGPDGRPRHYSVSGEPRTDAEGRFAGYRGVGHEITEIVEARERIAALAYSDALTGLANRTSFAPALEHAVRRARRNATNLATMYLDLDGFKQVNDRHGHDTGDRLLVEVAQRLRRALRASDQVARLGGDEFAVVLEDVPGRPAVEFVARKLIAEIGKPYPILADGGACGVTASVGVSLFPTDADSPRELLQHADAAMYRAKQESKNALRFYEGTDLSPSTPK
jgi:diguanylate cyclase (GGDEF)-like protein/PAS domain S-box-containing protein